MAVTLSGVPSGGNAEVLLCGTRCRVITTRPVSANPIYQFFATSGSTGPLLLRLWLAAIFFYHGTQKTFGLFGGDGWERTMVSWTSDHGYGLPYVIAAAAILGELIIAPALFLGLFTRLMGLLVVVLMTGSAFFSAPEATWEMLQLPITLGIIGLVLCMQGGGVFSLDRAISRQLLPTVGGY